MQGALKVLGIECSPRKASRSDKMLLQLFSHFPANVGTEIIKLCDKKIAQCEGCASDESGEGCEFPCIHTEDDTNWILEKLIEADILVISSPNHWASPSSGFHILKELMTALENNVYDIRKRYGKEPLEGKLFAILVSQEIDGAAQVLSQIIWPFSNMGMILVPYGLVFRNAILERKIVRLGLRAIGERRHEWINNTIRLCARNLVGMAERLYGYSYDDYKVIEPRD